MKVLITSTSLDERTNVSGISSVVRNIIAKLDEHCEFELIQIGKPDHMGTVAGAWFLLTMLLRGMFLLARNARRSVLHLNLVLYTKAIVRDFAFAVAAKVFGVPVLLHLHGGEFLNKKAPGLLGRVILWHFKLADKIILLSNLEVRDFNAFYAGFDEKVSCVYNSVDVALFVRDEHAGTNENLRVLFAGRLEPMKGVDIFLDVAASAPPQFDFFLAGTGSQLPLVQDAIDRGVKINYLGVLDSAQIRKFLLEIDVLVVPSRYGEGMPMIIVEALASSVVPIATAMASVPEIVIDQETGFLLDRVDADQIVARLTDINGDRLKMRRMSMNGHALAKARLDSSVNSHLFLSYYRKLMPVA